MYSISSFGMDSVFNDDLSIRVRGVTIYNINVHDTSGKLLYTLSGDFIRLLLISGLRYEERIIDYGMVKIRSCIVELSNMKEFNKLIEVIKLRYNDLEVIYNRELVERYFSNE